VKDKKVFLVCTLNLDTKLLPLYFLAKTAKEFGAKSICYCALSSLHARKANRGESVTSTYFANLISEFVDTLITIDPHLHRRSSLSEIYSIPTTVSLILFQLDKINIDKPILIGPMAKVSNGLLRSQKMLMPPM
jgi:ribose-phosphate pyrophosphokinase